jgi:hypothetical protein
MIWQLRVYTINRGKLDDFVQAWRKGVYPLRLQHGFRIPGAWVIRERNEFVWIVAYDGPEDWQAKEAAYYASAERAALDPDPAQYIAQAEQCFMTTVVEVGVGDQGSGAGEQ